MYVQLDDQWDVIQYMARLPKAVTLSDGTRTWNFDIMPVVVHNAEGYYEVQNVEPSYDATYQDIVLSTEVVDGTKWKRTFVAQDKDINELKTEKYESIDLLKSQKLNWWITFDSASFATMPDDIKNMNDLATWLDHWMSFPNPFSWTKVDGSEHVMDETKFNSFVTAVWNSRLVISWTAKVKKGQVAALTTAQAVANFDINSGR